MIELLVVIAIIAILSAVLMPNLFAAIDRAKEARDLANIKNAKTQALLDMIDGSEEGKTIFHDIRDAAIKALEENPNLKNLSPGSSRNKQVAEAIAEQMGLEVYSPSNQRYSIDGINIPNSSVTFITVNDKGVYLGADHLREDRGEEMAALFGYNIPAKKQDDNPDAYWSGTSAGSATLEDGRYVFVGHFRIRIFEY